MINKIVNYFFDENEVEAKAFYKKTVKKWLPIIALAYALWIIF